MRGNRLFRLIPVIVLVGSLLAQAPILPAQASIPQQMEMELTVGSTSYLLNNQTQAMDAAPVIKDGRAFLPIRYLAIPLGAFVVWNADEQKVTIYLNSNTIELWIGKNSALVNGKETPIDSSNPAVTPIMAPPGRTMLPLRFIAENLGCKVDWNQDMQMIRVVNLQP